jgi:hypothetical protein
MMDPDDGKVLIIGVDCATDPKKVGLAYGLWDGTNGVVHEMAAAGKDQLPAAWISQRVMAHRRCACLLALDAPLGWPAAFGSALASHSAGQPIQTEPLNFFRRETDRFISRTVGRRPLDVGAERIARTALSALQLVAQVSNRLGMDIPLLWNAEMPCGMAALEVYPAAVLQVLGLPASGYKEDAQEPVRSRILADLARQMSLPQDCSPALADADVLDALVCILAGMDFLAGRAMPPEDLDLAMKEGWIWVRQPT